MPPKKQTTNGYVQLEQKLALLGWLHRQLGYSKTTDLLSDLKRADEGFDSEDRSHIYGRLASQAGQLQGVTTGDLERYDDNIRQHLDAMNAGRAEAITLRYFQYLAALYTEIYLDRYCNRRKSLLRSLNEFVAQHNDGLVFSERWRSFADADLHKLAFWMATGSGKTLLLHLNYRQFLHYNQEPLDNILLITPNEGLTEQHIEELRASGIPTTDLFASEHVGMLGEAAVVKVTDINKLVLEKTDAGTRIPVEALEGNNLIFVDEGHKGSSTEAQTWRSIRNALAKDGFTFEYSATFGQALSGNEELMNEYGKAIAFDYSYRHFYNDGYGKDFSILNLQQEGEEGRTDALLLANLLSFYEQQLIFAEQEAALRPYNLARPLWMFIGRNVNAVYKEGGRSRSDILTVARFLHRVLSEPDWAVPAIDRLLHGQSNLLDEQGQDVFADRFEYLRGRGMDSKSVYRNALAKVMHGSAGGLQLCTLRGINGELGLKAAGSQECFGVIYIGDTNEFRQLVKTDGAGITFSNEAMPVSLFKSINEPNSTVNVLAGSRRFIEGWSSWRVSNMGLLNMGQSEGSQIIQLFGRGVRLRGRDLSLKRSSAFGGEKHPNHIRLLETLNIFALRANYMGKFREYLESEGIDTQGPLEMPLFIQPNQDFLNKGLVIPRLDEGSSFAGQETVLLQHDPEIRPVSVVMSATVQQITSGQGGVIETGASAGVERTIPPESLDLVDWDRVYLAMLEYKATRGLSNLLISQGALRSIMEAGPGAYHLEAEQSLVEPKSHAERQRLQEAVTNILRRYADALYRRRQARWESNHLTYRKLDDTDDNFRFNIAESSSAGKYIVRVPRDKPDLAQEIERLIADCKTLCTQDQDDLPRIHFDRHLYQPLLVEANGVTSSPPGLNAGERSFVADLRAYCGSSSTCSLVGTELFLLRNLSRGKGVGFFESSYFYPDFILWVKSGEQQRIVFIEPHGMRNENAYEFNEKAKLHESLPGLAEQIAKRSGIAGVQLDSFIVSATPYDELKKRYGGNQRSRSDFADKHILFQERNDEYDYVAQILQG